MRKRVFFFLAHKRCCDEAAFGQAVHAMSQTLQLPSDAPRDTVNDIIDHVAKLEVPAVFPATEQDCIPQHICFRVVF